VIAGKIDVGRNETVRGSGKLVFMGLRKVQFKVMDNLAQEID